MTTSRVRWTVLALVAILVLLLALPPGIAASRLATPPDLISDINWTDTGGVWDPPGTLNATFNGVVDIAAAFNNGRTQENIQLAAQPYVPMPALVMPTQVEWDAMTEGQKALYLIDRERGVRNVPPMEGLEANVGFVAQWYADWLLANDATGHSNDVDGDTILEDPWDRMHDDPNIIPGVLAPPAIIACHDFLPVGENLAYFWASSGAPAHWLALPVERAVYNWIYDDSGSAWGHRQAVLYDPYTGGSCLTGREGFMGIGLAAGGPHQGWDDARIVVMNMFDPCDTWAPCGPTAVDLASLVATPGGGFGNLVGLVGVGVLVTLAALARTRRRG